MRCFSGANSDMNVHQIYHADKDRYRVWGQLGAIWGRLGAIFEQLCKFITFAERRRKTDERS